MEYRTKFRKLKPHDWLKLFSIYFFSITIFTGFLLVYGAVTKLNVVEDIYIGSLFVIFVVMFCFRHDVLGLEPYRCKQKQKKTRKV